MVIRKLFKFEAAHIVRNCSTQRCKFNVHGHSFKIEVFFQSDKLDGGGMVMDFGLMKNHIKSLFEAFDHSYILWNMESLAFKDHIKSISKRWVETPFSPSAENLARFFHWQIQNIIDKTSFANGEQNVVVKSVRVHETDTGYAETEGYEPLVEAMKILDQKDIVFSPEILEDVPQIKEIQEVIESPIRKFEMPAYEKQL